MNNHALDQKYMESDSDYYALKSIFEHSPIGIAIVSPEGKKWLKVNKPICDITGYSEYELLHMDCSQITHPDDLGEDDFLTGQLLKGEIETFQLEKRYVHKNGSTIWIFLAVSLVRDQNNKPLYFIAQINDITEKKNIEHKLKEYTKNLERSNEDLDDFAHIVSHDLKEPLRGLGSNAYFLLEDYKDVLDEKAVKRLERIAALAFKMEKLIQDLLHFAKLKNQEVHSSSVDLNKVVGDVKDMMFHNEDYDDIQIKIPEKLPEIRVDYVMMTELFRNLIENGIKYNENKGKIIEIGYIKDYKMPDGSSQNVLYVKDNGIGIDKQYHNHIFKLFSRLSEEGSRIKGSGVGLTFVKKIVERYNGEIWIDSELGKGATFYFTLGK